jgi:transcriptional regulator with PAS, ATPase and Fis domain
MSATMHPRIAVISGIRLGGVYSLAEGEFVIGRDDGADLPIADTSISKRHCVVIVQKDKFHIEDCGTSAGTRLNGERITSRQALRHGDHIGVGNVELVFIIEVETNLPASPVTIDAAPMDPEAVAVPLDEDALHKTMVEIGKELRFYRRDVPSIREKLLLFIFRKIPAEGAAIVLIDKTGAIEMLAHRRTNHGSPVRVNQAMADRVYREGKSRMSPSAVCVPMQAFDARLGVIYAVSAGRHAPMDKTHLEQLSIIATVGASLLEHASRLDRIESEISELKQDLAVRHELVGESTAMSDLNRQVQRAAPTESTVLIQGESGTGKELVARAIHRGSRRSPGPFVAINCGAISESLLESELYGHEKGAFTGAAAQKKGKFELASGGTLFLDEVGEMPASIQVKLLRVLQEREIERLGGAKPIKVDFRLIAATNRDMETAVARGEFRQDLYFRLKVITITTPPLRNREDDILLLARHFIARFSRDVGRAVQGISPDAERMLKKYRWPGNVRELQNIMERAVAMGSTDELLPEDLPDELFEAQAARQPGSDNFNLQEARLAAQRDVVERALARTNGNLKEAAALLGVSPNHLYVVLKNLGISR